MLGTRNATPTLAVKGLAAARKFYEGPLGLNVAQDPDGNIHSLINR